MSELSEILLDLRDRLKRVEEKVDAAAAVALETRGMVEEVREWLLDEEQARIGVAKVVMDHERRLPKASNGR